MIVFHYRSLILAFALLLSGCSILQPVSPPVLKEYRLEAASMAKSMVSLPSSLSIEISTIRAVPELNGRHMLYVQHPYQIERFQQSEWQQKPASMLTPLVVAALEASGLFQVVLRSPNPINVNYRLELELVQLEQEFTTYPSVIHLGLRAYLTENKSHTIVAWQEFNVTQAAPTEDAYGGVIASRLATTEVLRQLVELCRSHVGQTNATP
ncbi:membrane integrity-associated transporter subunit PqiC [Undibacterium jejuense]|uniref:Membrane integrity-associated transporter subunit PqiC n=1 Tax=Undibacterium jejuense TaxID=1344949 RepID=A0A923HF03_9BURK|nr:ABC-type transport auxiliary lipoprotein family protein [Undibacterium jejuense]MBC3863332.1 membrane integrity-associated transporter subunit PqiC [Undibacterium jejuense]